MKGRWRLVVAGVVLTGACGHTGRAGLPSATGSGTPSTTARSGEPDGEAVTASTRPASQGKSGPSGGHATTSSPPSGGGSSSGSSTTPAASENLADTAGGPPGAFARTILRPAPATAVVIERLEQTGAAPRQATIDHVVAVMGREAAKPVRVDGPFPLSGGAKDWSADDIRNLAVSQGRAPQGGGQAVIRLLFLRGTFEGNDQVLGVCVRGDAIAIFSDQVTASATPLIGRALIERAVVTHEFGHALGLVDLVLATGRQDPEHPGHSTNQGSVMYWAVESSLVGQVLNGGPPDDFDTADRADLAALRNGA